ncbi:MAG: glycosyltransferase family protein [Patescibacteria group bacterium]|jgi:uncharacterized protein (TIGR00661 family)
MKYLLFVQCEGRGHLTQSLALKKMLEKRGHEISAIITGAGKPENLPDFFKQKIDCPLFSVESPRFITDKKGKGIKIFKSAIKTIYHSPRYFSSLKKIRKIVKQYSPDIFINFYEPLAGNYRRLYCDRRPMFCIGHQHFISHSSFKLAPINKIAKLSFKIYNRLTAPKNTIKIALSFTMEPDMPQKNLFVCPPLIREEIMNAQTSKQNFILVYLLNPGYSEEIINWNKKNPKFKIQAFWNKPENIAISPTLTFHSLSGQKFIEHLSSCDAYVATAGFDSIAEAAYLQKLIMMVPTKNHFEQKYNAFDAKRSGLAMSSDIFDLSMIIDNQKTPSLESLKTFRKWVNDYNDKIINLLEQ